MEPGLQSPYRPPCQIISVLSNSITTLFVTVQHKVLLIKLISVRSAFHNKGLRTTSIHASVQFQSEQMSTTLIQLYCKFTYHTAHWVVGIVSSPNNVLQTFHCFDAVHQVTGRASSLYENPAPAKPKAWFSFQGCSLNGVEQQESTLVLQQLIAVDMNYTRYSTVY